MERRTIELSIGGQKYRVVSSAGEAELQRLARIVTAKLKDVTPSGGGQPPQAILLAAMALAHEAETERGRRESIEGRMRDALQRMLVRIDEALEPSQGSAEAEGE
jgi:cell division protein ZapA